MCFVVTKFCANNSKKIHKNYYLIDKVYNKVRKLTCFYNNLVNYPDLNVLTKTIINQKNTYISCELSWPQFDTYNYYLKNLNK